MRHTFDPLKLIAMVKCHPKGSNTLQSKDATTLPPLGQEPIRKIFIKIMNKSIFLDFEVCVCTKTNFI